MTRPESIENWTIPPTGFVLPWGMMATTDHADREILEREYPGIKTKGELVSKIQEEWVSGRFFKNVDLGTAIDLSLRAYGRFLK